MRNLALLFVGAALLTACARPVAQSAPATIAVPTPAAASTAGASSPQASAGQSTGAAQSAAQGDAGADGLGDPLFPKLGNGGYDVQHYTIDLHVDVARNAITATTVISARATQPLAQFDLDFSGLNIRAISVDSTEAAFSRQGSELIIKPAHAIAPGALFSVAVRYDGSPNGVDDPSVDFSKIGWLTERGGTFVVSEPSGAMSWFPNNNHPLDKATYMLRITVPRGYVAAANGSLRDVVEAGAEQTYVWDSRDPIASYLVTVQINAFDVQTQTGPHGLPLRSYFPKGTPQSVKDKFAQTAEMIEFMEQRIAPYPFEAYGVVLTTSEIDFALETQTLSTFGPQGAEPVVVFHELMHQWFGNSVSLSNWRDVWLNEGFATYFQFLWSTREQGQDSLRETMNNWYDWMQDARTGPPIPTSPRQMFSPSIYYRGAYTLYALHMTVGDDAFYKIMRTYYERHKYGNAGTEDFVAVAEEIAGAPARDVLSAWLHQRDLPPKL